MKNLKNILYHVTLSSNNASITTIGISPEFSRGKMRVVWLVSMYKLEWAILHAAVKYNCSPLKLTVFSAELSFEDRTRFAIPGLFYAKDVVFPFLSMPALYYIAQENGGNNEK